MTNLDFTRTLVFRFKITSIEAMMQEAYGCYCSELFYRVAMGTEDDLAIFFPTAYRLRLLLEKR